MPDRYSRPGQASYKPQSRPQSKAALSFPERRGAGFRSVGCTFARGLLQCRALHQEETMSVAKIVELSGQSPNSFEDAVREVVDRASSTLRNIRSVWIKEFEAVVENDRVTQFRVITKVSFELDDSGSAA